MAGKSGSNGGSQWDTCGGSTLSAKLVRKMHPVVRKWPQIYPFGAKNDFFLPQMGHLGAISTPLGAFFWRISHQTCFTVIHHLFHFYHSPGASWATYGQKKCFGPKFGHFFGHFHTILCIFLKSFASRVVPPHVLYCDLPFVPLLPSTGGLWGPLMAKNCVFCPILAVFGPFPYHWVHFSDEFCN